MLLSIYGRRILNVPKGIVVTDKDGTIVVDLSKAKPFEGLSGAEVWF